MMPDSSRLFAAFLGAVALAVSATPSGAYEHTLQLAIDSDNVAIGNCDWSFEDASGTTVTTGIERLVIVGIETNSLLSQVTSVEIQACEGSEFGAASQVTAEAWPVGLGTGLSGSDVVEFALPMSLLDAGPSLRFYAGAHSAAGGRDALMTTEGTPAGDPILFSLATEVPALDWLGHLATAVAILVLGLVLLRNRTGRALWGAGLALLALRAASALVLGPDGQVGEWAGTPAAALDASGDSTESDIHSDLSALFLALDGDTLAVRIDVAELEVPVCGQADPPGSPPCDGLCGFGDEAAGPDCDGVCDAGDAPSGPDCTTPPNSPPNVVITVDGALLSAPLATDSGTTLQFVSQGTDEDGLGFAVPGFGGAIISYHWSLDGAEVPGPLWVFHPSPPITFHLSSGEATFQLALTVYDTLGASTTQSFDVDVTQQPPEVTLRANGELVGNVLSVPVGSTVQFETEASDADGLGFAHPAFGGGIVSYLWSIDDAQAANPLSVFSPDPAITFALEPSESAPESFPLTLSVYDTFGNVTQKTFSVDALEPACGCVNGMIWSDANGPCLEEAAIVDKLGEPTPSKITWRFAESAACWKFADDSWGVEEGVTLTAIEPNHTAACENWIGLTETCPEGSPPECQVGTVPAGEECLNGYMVNPSEIGVHSLDNRVLDAAAGFVEIPTALRLPYSPPADTSILKVEARLPGEDCRQCVQYMSVLTVLAEPPAQLSFRPPMTHAEKPVIPAVMDLSLLPDLPVLQSMPGDDEVFNFVQHTSSGWNVNWHMTNLVPWDARGVGESLPGYAPNMEFLRSQAFLYLATSVSPEDKQRVAVHLVQEGIDHYGALQGGFAWTSDAGIRNGRYLPIVFAAALLGSQEIADVLSAADLNTFSEWDHMAPAEGSPPASVDLEHWPDLPVILFGRESHTAELEGPYWDCYACFVAGTCGPPQELFPTGTNCSGKDLKDPYRRIDGGGHPGSLYMGVVWGPYKYTALMHWLVPALRPLWGPQRQEDADDRELLLRYVDRLEELGTWTQPDSCAPVGAPENYQLSWGPDPQNPGECIQGTGRSPELHGYDINLGLGARINDFGQEMWETYRDCAQDCSCAGMESLCEQP